MLLASAVGNVSKMFMILFQELLSPPYFLHSWGLSADGIFLFVCFQTLPWDLWTVRGLRTLYFNLSGWLDIGNLVIFYFICYGKKTQTFLMTVISSLMISKHLSAPHPVVRKRGNTRFLAEQEFSVAPLHVSSLIIGGQRKCCSEGHTCLLLLIEYIKIMDEKT